MQLKDDFVCDPYLLLYLPLHELDGISLMSRDAHGHPCTVTGALPVLLGRNFDGVDDHIGCGNSALFNPGSGDWSVAFWFKVAPGDGGTVLEKGNTNEWAASVSATQLSWFVRDTGLHSVTCLSVGAVDDGAWHQALGTWQASAKTAKLYLDAQLQDTETNTGIVLPITNTMDLKIGTRSAVAAPWFKGTLSEVRILSRALSAPEIQRDYLTTKWRYP